VGWGIKCSAQSSKRAPINANSLLELSGFCAWSATELPEKISIRKRMTKHLLAQSKRDRITPSGERSILSYGDHYKRVPENAAINPWNRPSPNYPMISFCFLTSGQSAFPPPRCLETRIGDLATNDVSKMSWQVTE
jgi:hypothetical protein